MTSPEPELRSLELVSFTLFSRVCKLYYCTALQALQISAHYLNLSVVGINGLILAKGVQ